MAVQHSDHADFWPLLARVLGRRVPPGAYTPADLPEWDSLRHVELIFELEAHYGIDVPQDRIATLFDGTDAILAHLSEAAARRG